ncbi:hypothetical protein ACPV5G_21210, partial [Photobacterium damselae]|uniref:hypothetical protein n=1 Tax=Photobacterium damselae TaxID=38293 RepID=UPI004068A02E
ISAGIADNVSHFERQIKSDWLKKKESEEINNYGNDSRIHSSDTQASRRSAGGGRDLQRTASERDDSSLGDVSPGYGGKTQGHQSPGGVRDLLSASDVGGARSPGKRGNDTERSQDDRNARTYDDGASGRLLNLPAQNQANYHIDDPKKLIGGSTKARFKRNQLALIVRDKIAQSIPL